MPKTESKFLFREFNIAGFKTDNHLFTRIINSPQHLQKKRLFSGYPEKNPIKNEDFNFNQKKCSHRTEFYLYGKITISRWIYKFSGNLWLIHVIFVVWKMRSARFKGTDWNHRTNDARKIFHKNYGKKPAKHNKNFVIDEFSHQTFHGS